MPDLRHGARAHGRAAGDHRQPRADRFHPAAQSRRAPVARAACARHGQPCVRHRPPPLPVGKRQAVAAAHHRHPRRAVVRLAVLHARLGFAAVAPAQYVHADRHGHRRCVPLQRRRHGRPRPVPRLDGRRPRAGSGLLRGRRRHRCAGARRASARASRPRAHRRGHPRPARPCAEDRAAGGQERQDRDRAARRGQGRRRAARAPGRQGADRRHRDRGQKLGR